MSLDLDLSAAITRRVPLDAAAINAVLDELASSTAHVLSWSWKLDALNDAGILGKWRHVREVRARLLTGRLLQS
jgi:hypothetical protein